MIQLALPPYLAIRYLQSDSSYNFSTTIPLVWQAVGYPHIEPKSYATKISSSFNTKSVVPCQYPLLLCKMTHQYSDYKTEGGKDAIKKSARKPF